MKQLLFALAALLIVLYFAKPASPWEFDEHLFFQGIHHYDPAAHHPPPPGFPLFMGAGHLMRLLIPTDFGALVTLSFIGSIAAFVLFALALGEMAGDLTIGIAAALLFYFSPALLVHSTLPISEPGALALLAAALYFAAKPGHPATWPPVLLATFAALTVGWRPQFSIFVVPFFLASLFPMRGWRDRAIALAVFTVVCLAWLIPLAEALGGIKGLIHFEASQAGYLAEHDADLSRSGWTPLQVALRFIAHPWGTKIASFPLLIVAGAGVVEMIRRRERRVIPLAIASAAYLAFALMVMDPADGVRYAIPFVLGTAFFAGVGAVALARRFSAPAYAFVAIFATGSVIYVSSLLSQRGSTWSPPVYAAAIAKSAFPSNAVPLYELPLWPHSQYYFRDRRPLRVNDGLAAYFDRPDVPLFIYADGGSHAPGARVFRWQRSDAYSKLTRNHYRVVSLIPVTPEQRFRAVRGVYAPEREQDGQDWRWLDSPAELQLPHGPARDLTVHVGLPVTYPIEANTLTISVDGGMPRLMRLERGRPIDIRIPIPAGAPIVRFEAARTFIPAEVPGSLNRDVRRLAVKLYDLKTSSAAATVRQVASR
ncbi:MAG: hypothetical protein ACXW19_04055 [Thermoanaerobaculia bacterium]